MPTYEYICGSGHITEDFQRMPGEDTIPCSVCGTLAEKQVSGGAGIIFKGSGFHATDYPKQPRKDKDDA